MKEQKMSIEDAKKEIEAQPTKKKGQWTKICKKVKDTGQPIKVTGITRGQCWALKRAAKDAKLEATVIDKSTGVIVLPPKKQKNKVYIKPT